jgi:Flp pilus assembly protein TadG
MRKPRAPRSGAAAVELALLLPFLVFLVAIAVDWARIFYYSTAVTNCARNGALWASDPVAQDSSPYRSISAAALAEAPDLTPTPTVTSTSGKDSSGTPYVSVTVSYPFSTITRFPGVPSSTNVTRTVRVNVAPATPG